MGDTYSTATALGEDVVEVNAAVEAERTVVKDIDPVALVVTRGVENADVPGFNEVASNEEILLIRGELDVVRTWTLVKIHALMVIIQIGRLTDDTLVLIGIIKTLGVLQV